MAVGSGVITHDTAVEVATDEVADDDGYVEDEDACEVSTPEVQGHAGVEKGIRNAVGEPAHNEEGHTEEQGKHAALARKGNSRGHDETAGNGEQATVHHAEVQARLEEGLRGLLNGHGG